MEGELDSAPTPALAEARDLAIQAATAAGQVQADCGLTIAPEDFVAGALKWGLMEVLTSTACLVYHCACFHTGVLPLQSTLDAIGQDERVQLKACRWSPYHPVPSNTLHAVSQGRSSQRLNQGAVQLVHSVTLCCQVDRISMHSCNCELSWETEAGHGAGGVPVGQGHQVWGAV